MLRVSGAHLENFGDPIIFPVKFEVVAVRVLRRREGLVVDVYMLAHGEFVFPN